MARRVMFVFLVPLLALASLAAWAEERELRVAAPWEAKGLDPVKSGFVFSRMGSLERLVGLDERNRLTGLLARSWETSADGLTWTFLLRPGVKFHDGNPLRAVDVARSLNWALARKGVLATAPVEKIEASGQDKVVIVTREPFSPLPAFLAHYSSGVLAASCYQGDEVTEIIATGPYRLVEHQAGRLFRFRSFEGYWGQRPRIARTVYQAVPQGETRAFMIQAGQADLAFTLSPMAAARIDRSGEARVVIQTIPRTRLLKFNCQLPFFKDVRVRQALSLALDRPAMARTILRNPDSAASQLLPPVAGPWHDPDLPPLSHSPQKAREILAQAGWRPGSDGVLAKDGLRFEVELLTYSARPMLPPLAAAIQDQLKAVGVKVTIKIGQDSAVVERHKDKSLQMALLARNFGQVPDPIGSILSDFGPGGGVWGAMGWSSPEMAGLLKAYYQAFDPAKAEGIRQKILALIQDELPVVPVTWYENIVAMDRRLTGLAVDPFEISYHLEKLEWAK